MPLPPHDSPIATPVRQLDRRTVVRTAAWSVPAVSLAMGAPAFAASQETSVNLEGTVGIPLSPFNRSISVHATLNNDGGTVLNSHTVNLYIPLNLSLGAGNLTVAAPVGWTLTQGAALAAEVSAILDLLVIPLPMGLDLGLFWRIALTSAQPIASGATNIIPPLTIAPPAGLSTIKATTALLGVLSSANSVSDTGSDTDYELQTVFDL